MACYDTALHTQKPQAVRQKPIASHQLVQDKLAWMITEISKGQFARAARRRLKDQTKSITRTFPCSKMNNVAIALETARKARDILAPTASSTFTPSWPHEHLESVYTYEGTNDIHKLVIANASPHLRLRVALLAPNNTHSIPSRTSPQIGICRGAAPLRPVWRQHMRLGTIRFAFLLLCISIFPVAGPAPAQRKAPPDPARPKIRAITAFINLDRGQYQQQVADAMTLLKRARTTFESRDYEVETIRISTQPFPEYTRDSPPNKRWLSSKITTRLAEQQNSPLHRPGITQCGRSRIASRSPGRGPQEHEIHQRQYRRRR